jgi:hypothetical protein
MWRTDTTLSADVKVEPKVVAAQLGRADDDAQLRKMDVD